jgi:hypothetical protein
MTTEIMLGIRYALATIVALALGFGCSTERPTRFQGVTGLPATPITAVLLVDSSTTVLGPPSQDSIWEFDFSSSLLFESGDFDDASVGCYINNRDPGRGLFLYDFMTSQWKVCPQAIPYTGLVGCGAQCIARIERFGSEIGGPVKKVFVNPAGRLKVLAPQAWKLRAKLLRYTPEYDYAIVLQQATSSASSLDYRGGALYGHMASLNYFGIVEDTLVGLDLEGGRRWALALPGAGINDGTVFDGSRLWVRDYGAQRIRAYDTTGTEIVSIATHNFYSPAMAWIDGTLWFVSGTYPRLARLLAMDLEQSLADGGLRTTARFALRSETVQALCAHDDGILVNQGGSISLYSMTGELLRSYPLPVLQGEGMSWDGSSLWMFHHGPHGAYTDATLLSRFTLE